MVNKYMTRYIFNSVTKGGVSAGYRETYIAHTELICRSELGELTVRTDDIILQH
jgi:hypothetical protein